MKNILITLFLFCATNQVQVQAQEPDPQLFNTTWYLNELTIDTVSYPVPSNDEIDFVSILITKSTLEAPVCLNPIIIISVDDQILTILSIGLFNDDESCVDPDNFLFESKYLLDFYLSGDQNSIPNPIAYEILTDADGNLELTLTNSNGDIAIYGDVLLNVQDQEAALFSMAPNPVIDVLSLHFSGNTENTSMTVYDALGSEVYFQNNVTTASSSLNLAHLQSGLYFVQVVQGNQKNVQKFVKR